MAKYNEMGMRWCAGHKPSGSAPHWQFIDSFTKYIRSEDDLQPMCKECRIKSNNVRNPLRYGPNADPNLAATYRSCGAKNRADRIKRTPKWADLEKIKEFYKNRPEGYHVDHIIPLKGDNVSGLHVHYNLQYLTAEENLQKGNSYEAGMGY